MLDSVSDPLDSPLWWGVPRRGAAPSVVDLIRQGVLDAELAALIWLLVEARVPILVAAGPRGAGKTATLTALLEFLPPGARRFLVRGEAEDFAWLPEAARLGWRGPSRASVGGGASPPVAGAASADPRDSVLLVPELSHHLPWYAWGEVARVALRAPALGYGLAATIHGERLEDVLGRLGGPPIGLSSDELSHLGVVLVQRALRGPTGDLRRRIVAAHYLRPVARDVRGHVQRLPPAVLGTWDERADRHDHFAWGVASELAGRVGREATDFEREQARRAEYLAGLAAAGVSRRADVRAAIEGYREVGRTSH